jgi:hypothetical protein
MAKTPFPAKSDTQPDMQRPKILSTPRSSGVAPKPNTPNKSVASASRTPAGPSGGEAARVRSSGAAPRASAGSSGGEAARVRASGAAPAQKDKSTASTLPPPNRASKAANKGGGGAPARIPNARVPQFAAKGSRLTAASAEEVTADLSKDPRRDEDD